jgi:hypothetical protein
MEPVTVGLRLVFAVLALVFFLLAGLAIPNPPRLQWMGWGLFFLTLAFFVAIQIH